MQTPVLSVILIPCRYTVVPDVVELPPVAESINETADELCNTPVINVPDKTERMRPLVEFRIKPLNERPARFLMDSSIKNMPNMKMPSPARSFHTSKDSGVAPMLTIQIQT